MGNTELARIFEKVVRYHLGMMKLPSLAYDFFISGGITGLGIMKLNVIPRIVWTGEVITKEIQRDEEKDKKKLPKDVQQNIPTDPDEIMNLILDDIKAFTGEGEPQRIRLERQLGPKRRLEVGIEGEVVDPRNYAWEPNATRVENSGYRIERITKKFYELEPLFESHALDKSKREDLLKKGHHVSLTSQSLISTYESQKIVTRDQLPQQSAHTPDIELLEYYGPLLGKDGRVIEENRHFIVATGKTLLKDRRIGFWDQLPPHVTARFSRSPFKAAGEGIADNAIDQQLLTNDLWSNFIDMMKLASYPPFVVDMNAIHNKEDIEEGLFPNQRIETFGKSAKEVFSQLQFDTNVGTILFQTLNRLEQQAFSAAGVDVTSANQASRARITASEVNANVDRSDESLLALGRELDENFIVPIIQKVMNITLQFGFETGSLEDLHTQGIITSSEFQLVSNIPKIERYNEIKRNFKIRVKGFRERIERHQSLANSNELLDKLSRMPESAQSKIDWNKAVADMVEQHGFEPNRWLIQNNPQDTAREENALLRTGKMVSILPDERHELHLPVHYEVLRQTPTDAAVQHILLTLQAMQELGIGPPEIPDDIRAILGFPPEPIGQNGAGQTPPIVNGAGQGAGR